MQFSSILVWISSFLICCNACKKDVIEIKNEIDFKPKLSDYSIFQGKPSELIPNTEYKFYELSSALFSDYAEKQRLIKVPSGSTLSAVDNGLLDFPDGTIIVKTFYYYLDKRDPSKGKNIIETRLLIKSNEKWSAATYKWNPEQTDANLISSASTETVNWIDDKGKDRMISYHIPSRAECTSCHYFNNEILPIGPKVRNLNFEVIRGNIKHNQLDYLHKTGILSSTKPSAFATMPNYNNQSAGLQARARAYLDINCAHCHTDNGFAASEENLRLSWETGLEESKIIRRKGAIVYQMERKDMPKIGTTVIDQEGLQLIRNFVDSLEAAGM